MSRHCFSPEIAALVGVNAAVIYQNLGYWVEKNAANSSNFHEGRYWTYNSVSAFNALFPYLSPKQIRTAIDKLIQNELILKGKFSKNTQDQTNWYSVNSAKELSDETPVALSGKWHAQKGKRSAVQGKSYKNKYKPNIKPSSLTCEDEEVDLVFEKIWESYPRDRRRNKQLCKSNFENATTLGVPSELILSAVMDYENSTQTYTRSKVKFSDNWFKDSNWPELAQQANLERETSRQAIQQSLDRCKSWIITGHKMCQHITKSQIAALLETKSITPKMLHSAGLDV